MGRRGPKPTPTAILKVRGSWRARLNPDEPQPQPGIPSMPGKIRPEAKLAWKRIVPKLQAMGVLTTVDGETLARYCTLAARYWEAEDFLRKHGQTYPVRDGDGVSGFRKFPQASIANELAATLARIEASFGMTPADRTRLRTEATTDGAEDETAKLIKVR